MMKAKKNIGVIAILLTVFAVYNFFIYTSEKHTVPIKLSSKAVKGQKLWQNNNCSSNPCNHVSNKALFSNSIPPL